jgi:hypothetical protein
MLAGDRHGLPMSILDRSLRCGDCNSFFPQQKCAYWDSKVSFRCVPCATEGLHLCRRCGGFAEFPRLDDEAYDDLGQLLEAARVIDDPLEREEFLDMHLHRIFAPYPTREDLQLTYFTIEEEFKHSAEEKKVFLDHIQVLYLGTHEMLLAEEEKSDE